MNDTQTTCNTICFKTEFKHFPLGSVTLRNKENSEIARKKKRLQLTSATYVNKSIGEWTTVQLHHLVENSKVDYVKLMQLKI